MNTSIQEYCINVARVRSDTLLLAVYFCFSYNKIYTKNEID